MDVNKLIVSGRMTQDVEVTYVGEKKTPIAKGSIAFGGQNKDHSNFINFVVWDKYGEVMAQYLKKGTAVLLDGRLRQDRWETPDGNRSNYVMEVQNMTLLGSKADREAAHEVVVENAAKTGTKSAKKAKAEVNADGIETVPF